MLEPIFDGSMSMPPTTSIQFFSAASLTDSTPMGPRPNCATFTFCGTAGLLASVVFQDVARGSVAPRAGQTLYAPGEWIQISSHRGSSGEAGGFSPGNSGPGG